MLQVYYNFLDRCQGTPLIMYQTKWYLFISTLLVLKKVATYCKVEKSFTRRWHDDISKQDALYVKHHSSYRQEKLIGIFNGVNNMSKNKVLLQYKFELNKFVSFGTETEDMRCIGFGHKNIF